MTDLELMIKARAGLITSKPFFGHLSMKLKLVETTTVTNTMATDGMSVYFNPKFVKMCTPPELKGVLAHEVMHCALLHATRRGERAPKLWNDAADYVVNPLILKDGFYLPEGGLDDKKYHDMSTDQIYDLLAKDAEQNPKPLVVVCVQGDSPEDPKWGEVLDAPKTDENGKEINPEELENEWRVSLAQAAKTAKNMGQLPAYLEKLIETIVNPQVSWKTVLRNFLTRPMKNDYSWTKLNRRYIANELYLPSLYSEGMGRMVIAVDTSGSIGKQELEQFQSEVNSILEDVTPEKVTVLYVDTRIAGDPVIYEPEDLPIKLIAKGGGGTKFNPPFNWIEENNEEPDAFVYLTDMYGECTVDTPPYPVLWVSTTNKTDAPFGQVIKLYEN